MVNISKVKSVLFGTWLLWIVLDIVCLVLQAFFNFELVTARTLSKDITNIIFVGWCYLQIKAG